MWYQHLGISFVEQRLYGGGRTHHAVRPETERQQAKTIPHEVVVWHRERRQSGLQYVVGVQLQLTQVYQQWLAVLAKVVVQHDKPVLSFSVGVEAGENLPAVRVFIDRVTGTGRLLLAGDSG